MESRDTVGSLPNLRNDVDQHRNDRSRAIEMKTMAKSSSCLSTTTRESGSDTASRASTLPREKRMSWSACFQLQYVDSVIAGAKAGDHVKMTELVGKLGTEGFAAIIREHDGKNNGPLHYAALNNDVLMAKLLLQYGADVNDVGEGGKRPLHFAAILRAVDKVTPMQDSEPGGSTLYLTKSQYSSDEKSDSDESPVRSPKTFLGFLKKKDKKKSGSKSMISLNFSKNEEEQPQPVAASTKSLTASQAEEENGINVEAVDDEKGSEKHRVEENIVDILLSAGADASAKDTKGTTPLHLALMHANVDAFKQLLTVPGVDIDAQDRRGTTPLFKACKSGNTDGVLILINKGADILIADVNGDTPLHVAVRHSHNMIVMALIESAQSKGQINTLLMHENSRGVIPLYDAVRCGHRDLFQVCLSHVSKRMSPGWEVDIDRLINFSSREHDDTLLHVAAAAGYLDIVETLINHGALVNRVNFDGQTPLHLACARNHENIALSLLENGGDVSMADSACLNPLQVAVNNGSFETLMTLLQYISASSGGQSDEATDILQWSAAQNKADTLRKILDYEFRFHEMTDDGIMDFIVDAVKNKHLETVHVLVRWNRAVVDHLDKLGNTPLHHAAEGGHDDIAHELIQAKAQVNARNGLDLGGLSPLHYIAARGWIRTARVLLDSYADINQRDNSLMTPLHHACKHGQLAMVELLLYSKGAGTVTKPADITIRDAEGRNCLDHAIDNGHEAIATMIITHDRWQEVMSVSSRDEETNYLTTPMRKLIRSMPAVAKVVLDRCITVTGGTSVRDNDVRIEFYYEFLEDAFSPWMKSTDDAPPKTGGAVNALLNRMYRRVSTHLPSDAEDQYDKRDHLIKSAEPFIRDSQERNDYHPLQLMVSSQRVELLDHPLVTTFIKNKWNTIGRYLFYLGFFVYITFLAMLTGYIVVIPPNYYIRAVNHNHSNKILWFADGERRWVESIPDSLLIMFDVFGPTAIIILSLLNIFREFGQMFVQRLSYFRDGGNIMELFLYTAAILFSLPFSRVEYVGHSDIKKGWQWPIGAGAGFLGWINLLLFIRSNSKLGIYVIMFIDIFKTFLRFCLILFLFVMAFGLAFYALLMNQNPFHSLFDSLAKTFVMMIGELDYADIFFAQDYLGTSNTLETDGEEAYFMNSAFYLGITQVFFILFLIVMSILMMNMLVGLAVDDIQAIQEKANLHRLTMQVNMAMENQSKFPLWTWRRSVVRRKTFLLNEVRLKKWLRRLTGGRKQLKRALQIGNEKENPLTIESSNEEVYYEKVRGRMKEMHGKIERATAEMMEDTKKREAQLDQIRGDQSSLLSRTDHLQAAQERLADRVEVMHRKMDVMIKKLKIKQKKVEGLF